MVTDEELDSLPVELRRYVPLRTDRPWCSVSLSWDESGWLVIAWSEFEVPVDLVSLPRWWEPVATNSNELA